MRTALLAGLILAAATGVAAQKSAPRPQPEPETPPPAAPARPTPRPAAPQPQANSGRGGVNVVVTDLRGDTLGGIRVDVSGPTERVAETDGQGQLNLDGLRAGTYRLTFSGDAVTTFEREVTVRGNAVADVDVTLRPAPEAPPAPEPVVIEQEAAVGPRGAALTIGIPDLLETEFVGRQSRRESLLSCSGNARATMIQLNEPLPPRLYEDADMVYYVLGGEGTVTMGNRDARIGTNGFVSIPRGTIHSFNRRGDRPLVLLAVLSGEPCEQPK